MKSYLTVIMSVYNGEPYLRLSVESILNQTYSDFTFIIVNNGSTDNTAAILNDYARRDSRVNVITNPHTLTYVEGRMLAISEAKTEWVALMDADDISLPKRLERQMAALKAYPDQLSVLGTWGNYINEEGQILGTIRNQPTTLSAFKTMHQSNEPIVLIDPSSIFHLPTFKTIGGYRSECAPAADLDFWYRMAETGRALLILPEVLFHYRIHAQSESVSRTLLQRKKTHFVNYNMRLRRSHRPEISWDEFCKNIWGRFRYRLKRIRNDLALMFYKRAGMNYGNRQYGKLFYNLLMAGILNPQLVCHRIYHQWIKR